MSIWNGAPPHRLDLLIPFVEPWIATAGTPLALNLVPFFERESPTKDRGTLPIVAHIPGVVIGLLQTQHTIYEMLGPAQIHRLSQKAYGMVIVRQMRERTQQCIERSTCTPGHNVILIGTEASH